MICLKLTTILDKRKNNVHLGYIMDYTLEFKLHDIDEETGVFEGIGNKTDFKDFADDIIEKGAFQKSISKKMPKLLWQHKADEPIGIFTEAFEDGEGLKVKGRLLIKDVQRAREAHALLKAGAIDGLSIGFSIPAGGAEMKSDGTRIIKEVNLHEVSLVTFPCNDRSTVSSVKMYTKGTSLISAMNARIDKITEDDDISRADVVSDLATAAGISADAVNAILAGEINMPPEKRLRAFARVLGVSLSSLMDASDSDEDQTPQRTHEPEKSVRHFEQVLRDAGLSKKQAKTFISSGYKAMLGRDDLNEDEQKNTDTSDLLEFLKTK